MNKPVARRALLVRSAAAFACIMRGDALAASPDAELLQLDRELKKTIAQRDAFRDSETYEPDQQDEMFNALCDAVDLLAERMVAIEPMTAAGVEAKARAIRALEIAFWSADSIESDIIKALLRDLRSMRQRAPW